MLFQKKIKRALDTQHYLNSERFGEGGEDPEEEYDAALTNTYGELELPENYEPTPEDIAEMERADRLLEEQRKKQGLKKGSDLEKGDLSAMIISALLVFLPVIVLVLGGISFLMYWLFT